MTRREVREHLFCLLFSTSFFQEEDNDEQFDLYWDQAEDVTPSESELDEIKNKLLAIKDKTAEIDALIENNSKGWKLSRIGNADINIMRIAIYEILWDDNVPTGVAINEAVELAKKYGTDDNSAGFINGILASVVKDS